MISNLMCCAEAQEPGWLQAKSGAPVHEPQHTLGSVDPDGIYNK